jgi:predicted RNA-binding Zn-ribbon protein involved in translation (DUF1610 family)
MIEKPLCPHCGNATFDVKRVSFPHSTENADFIFCTSCGKIIGQLMADSSYEVDQILQILLQRFPQ